MTATAHAGNWREAGACLDADPDLFFPISVTGLGLDQIDQARDICARCDVQRRCLEYSLTTRQMHGIWGGTTPDERRVILRRRTRTERPFAQAS